MPKTRGLGKGLSALFQEKIDTDTNSDSETPYLEVDINCLSLNPNQPRKFFSQEGINELALSIKNQGLLQPILVRPLKDNDKTYEIVAGERRYRAAKLAGLTKVPVIITQLSDEETLVVALIENLQREDLNCIEEAEALKRIKELMGITQDELALRVGKSRPHISNLLRILNLEEEIKEGLKSGIITQGHGRALLTIENSEHRIIAYRYIAQNKLSVRDVERLAKYWTKNKTLPSYCLPKPTTRLQKSSTNTLKKIKTLIQSKIPINTTIRGSLESGSISLKYNSPEELKLILKAIGIDTLEEDVSRETNSQ